MLSRLGLASRCYKKGNAPFGHETLESVHVNENTLRVTSGAPRFRPHFRLLTRCFKYAAFHMLSGTHVRRTTLRVTFGARRRSIPSGLLDRLLGHSDHQGRPRAPEWFRRATVWAASVAQGCHPNLISSGPQRHPGFGRVPSVRGSAMHMKWPDGIGREAGIGRTQNREELTVFRACPC